MDFFKDRFIKNYDLLAIWIPSDKKKKLSANISKLNNILKIADECPVAVEEKIDKISNNYCLALAKKWKDCFRCKKYLVQRHSEWLDKYIYVSEEVLSLRLSEPQPICSRGRPEVAFSEASLRTKRRRVQDLVSSRCPTIFLNNSTAFKNRGHLLISLHCIST